MNTKTIAAVLGGPKAVGKVRTLSELRDKVRAGLSWGAYESVQSHFQVTSSDFSRVAALSSRTLARRRGNQFEPDESDRLLRLARVFAHALQVFESKENAAKWMGEPNRALGGVPPFSILDTDIGVQQVEEELGRIEYGIFA